MLLVYTIVAATIPAMVFAPSVPLIKVGAFLFGIGLGGDYMVIPLMAAELFGLRMLGRVMGIVLTADGVAEAVVPMAVATIRDRDRPRRGQGHEQEESARVAARAVALLP